MDHQPVSSLIKVAPLAMRRAFSLFWSIACVALASPASAHANKDWHTIEFKTWESKGQRRVEVRLISKSRDAIRVEQRSTTVLSNGKDISHLFKPQRVSVDCKNGIYLYESTGVAYKKDGAFWQSQGKFRNSPAMTRDFEYICRHFGWSD